MASKETLAVAPPETPTTLVVVVNFAAVPMSRPPCVESWTFAPASTVVVTVPVSREARPANENAPPLQVPTLSAMATFDDGRMEMPPAAARLVPETIVAPSPRTTRDPASIVIVLPPDSESPADETTPPPATFAEWPDVVRWIVCDEPSDTVPRAAMFAPAATTARASAVLPPEVVVNVATGRPPPKPVPKYDSAVVE